MEKKYKIAIIIDVDWWAFANNAKALKKYISNKFDVDIIPLELFDGNMVKILLLCQKYDLIHFMWRGILYTLSEEYVKGYLKTLGGNEEEFLKQFLYNKKITTAVCDHLYINEEDINITKYVLSIVNKYSVTSKILKKEYENIEGIPKPNRIIHDGVDLEIFKPSNLDRLQNPEKIIVGWVGNSKFKDNETDDLKGVNKIILPAIKELTEEGYNIEIKLADRNENRIEHEKMKEYYNSINLYICASKTEGTPLPILESMACGIPIISTRVGIVEEAFGDKQKDFILQERTKDELKNKIKNIIENKNILMELSSENLENVKKWSWKEIAKDYERFFEETIKEDNKILN